LLPINGATNVSLPVTLSWNPDSGATSYDIVVATDSMLNNWVFAWSSLTTTSIIAEGLDYNTTYYWSIWASTGSTSPADNVKPGNEPKQISPPISLSTHELKNKANLLGGIKAKTMGDGSVQSAVWSFTTELPPLSPPILLLPINGATNVSLPVTLSWNPDSGATSYNLIVATDSALKNVIFVDSSLTTISVNIDGLDNSTSYFWNVSATIDPTNNQDVHSLKKKQNYFDGIKTKVAGVVISPTSATWSFTSISELSKKGTLSNVGSIIPKEYSLLQNYPNPGNPSTQIRFDVPEATKVRLLVYDILGRIVKVLVDAELSAGSYIVTWDGTEENKHQVSSGMYLYRLWTDKFNNTKKLLILK
jgi:hypothetical protein